ncbi:zinc-dependent peptidase [Thalassolituus sp. LLYu03]|uniref:M90 family metallopeptidase n=1 Tax=Thalassolituus sp. LLYu03 TaxID=3421656 RepID=UPI003D292EF2
MLHGLKAWLEPGNPWRFLKQWLGLETVAQPLPAWPQEWSAILQERVHFYRELSDAERPLFEQRCLQFLADTRIEGGVEIDVTDTDRLLVAASAVIPVWGFPDWHYFNVDAVFLLPGPFNDRFECGQPDSRISGMVGSGPMSGKLALSRPDLHAGFANGRDKHNVGIHEFAHLIDGADGRVDGFPERMEPYRFAEPWFALVQKKVQDMEAGDTGIPQYGATNPAEFFAVASEYFFERPELMQKKHPQLYHWLSEFYRQNRADAVRAQAIREATQRAVLKKQKTPPSAKRAKSVLSGKKAAK